MDDITDGVEHKAPFAVGDSNWIENEFITVSQIIDPGTTVLFQTVRDRGGVIIEKRKACSAFSAAKAACDHMYDWITVKLSLFFVVMFTYFRERP